MSKRPQIDRLIGLSVLLGFIARGIGSLCPTIGRRPIIERLFIVLALLAFIGGGISSVWTLRTATRLPTGPQENVLWGVTQAQTELHRTMKAFADLAIEKRNFGDQPNPLADSAKLRFDILWSRVNLFRAGSIGLSLKRNPEYYRIIRQIDAVLNYVDTKTPNIETLNQREAFAIVERLEDLVPVLNSFALFALKQEKVEQQNISEVRKIEVRQLLISLAGTLIAFAGFVIFIMRGRANIRSAEAENKELQQARDMAEAANQAKATFLATMSHEIRTPINGVLTMAQILDDTTLTIDQQEMTRTIRQSSESLLTIINDILDFSKIEAGKLPIEKLDFNLIDQIDAVCDLTALHAEEAGLAFRLELDDKIQEKVIGDPTRLRQILLNLTSNAVKFTSNGAVTLRVQGKKDASENFVVRVEVEDTGIGMTKDQVQKLFLAFHQADSSTARRFGGTGLGLAISERLTSLLGGNIGATSKEGKGSTFWFEIPFGPHTGQYLQPRSDLSSVTVLLGGFDQDEARSLTNLLRLGGVYQIAQVSPEDVKKGLDRSDAGRLVILNGRFGKHNIINWLEKHQSTTSSGMNDFLIAAPQKMLVELKLPWASYPRARYLGTIATPIHVKRLWEFIAVSAGVIEIQELRQKSAGKTIYSAPPNEVARKNNAMVLVAEDNIANKMVITKVLARQGIAHEIADNGKIAIDMLKTEKYDLLLTDFHMPVMDGFQLTSAKRTHEAVTQTARMPIIAITSDVFPETAQRCQAVGMDGYLRKPIDLESLHGVLKKYIPTAFHIRSIQTEDLLEVPQGRASNQTVVMAANPWISVIESIDLDIFNPAALIDIFGDFNEEAAELVSNYVATLAIILNRINTAFASQDYPTAQSAAHELKGASLSTGAVRLGQLAMDIEKALNDDDVSAAKSFHKRLDETAEQLTHALSGLIDLVEKHSKTVSAYR